MDFFSPRGKFSPEKTRAPTADRQRGTAEGGIVSSLVMLLAHGLFFALRMRDAKHFGSMVTDEVTRAFCICFCNKRISQLGTYRSEGNSSAVAYEQDFSEFKYMGRV